MNSVIPKHEFPTWYACAFYPLSLSFTSIKQKEDERLRTQLRRENQQRRMRERSQAKGLSASFLEPDRYEDEGEDLEQSLLVVKGSPLGPNQSQRSKIFLDQSESSIQPM